MFLVSCLRLLKKQPFDWRESGSCCVEGSPVEKGLSQYYCQVTLSTIEWGPCRVSARGMSLLALYRLQQM